MRDITKFDAEVITGFHPLFRVLLWVAAARSKDDDRFILQHVHVERNDMEYNIVATDGKRMHVGTFDPGLFDDDILPLAIGEYEVVAKTAKLIVLAINDEAGDFPNWRVLMPSGIPFSRETVTRATIGRIGIRSGVLLATDFAMEACGFGCGFGKDESVNIEYASERPGAPFLISHELGKAMVMPILMDGNEAVSEAEATGEIPGALAGLAKAMKPGDTMTVSADDEPCFEMEMTDDGPRIVDAGEDNDFGISEFNGCIIALEAEPKNSRHRRLAELLKLHGPANIRKLDEYRTWTDADRHLVTTIQECINSLPDESEPEGDSDY